MHKEIIIFQRFGTSLNQICTKFHYAQATLDKTNRKIGRAADWVTLTKCLSSRNWQNFWKYFRTQEKYEWIQNFHWHQKLEIKRANVVFRFKIKFLFSKKNFLIFLVFFAKLRLIFKEWSAVNKAKIFILSKNWDLCHNFYH